MITERNLKPVFVSGCVGGNRPCPFYHHPRKTLHKQIDLCRVLKWSRDWECSLLGKVLGSSLDGNLLESWHSEGRSRRIRNSRLFSAIQWAQNEALSQRILTSGEWWQMPLILAEKKGTLVHSFETSLGNTGSSRPARDIQWDYIKTKTPKATTKPQNRNTR